MNRQRKQAKAAAAEVGYPAQKASTRARPTVNYDDKVHVVDVEEDIQHDVAHVEETSGLRELEQHVNDVGDSWETDSLFKDVIEDLTEDRVFTDDPEACTADQVAHYRQLLRKVGPEQFYHQTIGASLISTKKLLTAFGIRPPAFMEGCEDDQYEALLTLAMTNELRKRAKLDKFNTVDDAVDLIQSAQNIIVLTGAGISTSLGIPDFRSKGTGLYSKLEHLGLSDPQEVFDISLFHQDPTIFFSVARDILPSHDRFTPTHAFIKLLQDKGKLLTNYSQNIDNLEARAGIRPDKLVQCHGSFATATCQKCGHKVVGDTLFTEIRAGKIPRCRKCAQGSRTTANSRKRKLHKDGTEKKPARRRPCDWDSNSDSEFDVPAGGSCGVMKPDITFFGEPLPVAFWHRLAEHDRHKVDLVIVIGTSLKVAPVSEVVAFLPSHIPQIYISRQSVSHVNFDIDLLGDCDVVVSELCRRANWDLRHEMVSEHASITIETSDSYPSRHMFTHMAPQDTVSVKEEAAGEVKQSVKSETRRESRTRQDVEE